MSDLSQDVIDNSKLMAEKVMSKALQDKLFLPFALDLLSHEIVWTNYVPKGAPAATDGTTIYINPESPIFQLNGITPINCLTWLLLHEDSHILLYHGIRLGPRDSDLWNIACDFMINLLLKNIEDEATQQTKTTSLVDMKLGKWGQNGNILYSETFENMVEEEIYDYLEKNGHFKKKKSKMSMSKFLNMIGDQDGDKNPDGNQEGQEEDGQGKEKKDEDKNGQDKDDEPDGDINITETKFEFEGKKYNHTTIEFPQFQPASGKEGEEQQKKNKERDKAIRLNRQMLQDTLLKGTESLKFQKFLGKLFDVKVSWEDILKDSLMTAFEKTSELAWGHPRISWLANPHMPFMPDKVEEEKYGTVIMSSDESGSMSDDDARKAIDIVRQAKDHYKNIYFLKHDVQITFDKFYDEIDDDVLTELLTRQSYGGTSHQYVFEHLVKFMRENPDEIVSAYIGITDLASDIQEHQNMLPSHVPVIYLTNNDYYSKEINGRIIQIK